MTSEKTLKMYESCLKKLGKLSKNKHENILDFISKMSLSAQSNTLCGILKLHRDELSGGAIEAYSKRISDISKEKQKKYDKNLMTDKEKEVMKKWTDIINIDTSKFNLLEKVLYSLYTEFEPRRVVDYQDMIYVNKLPFKTNRKDPKREHNYLVLSKRPYFYFTNYKTADHEKCATKKEGTNADKRYYIYKHKFIDLLKEYTKDMEYDDPLFNFSETTFKRKLTNIFGSSVNMLRHSYISYFNSLPTTTLEKRKRIADRMGHSVLLQLQYNKIDIE